MSKSIIPFKFDHTRQNAIIWSIEDVQIQRPDLSDQEAFQVLQVVKRQHSAEHGINWETIEYVAEFLFPDLCGRKSTEGQE